MRYNSLMRRMVLVTCGLEILMPRIDRDPEHMDAGVEIPATTEGQQSRDSIKDHTARRRRQRCVRTHLQK